MGIKTIVSYCVPIVIQPTRRESSQAAILKPQ